MAASDWKRGIFWAHALLLFLPIAAVIGTGAYLLCRAEEVRQHTELAARMRDVLSKGVTAIDTTLQIPARDLKYLAASPAFQSAVKASDAAALSMLAKNWAAFASAKQMYGRIRWIDETGMERVKVVYAGSGGVIALPGELKNLGNRYFFLDAMQLNRGAVYVSPLDLTFEDEKVWEPYVPTIRFGTPVSDGRGVRRGILLLNYFANDLMNRFQELSQASGCSAWMVNAQGYWLKGPNPDDEFGFMFGREDVTIAARYPEAWQKILEKDEGQFETKEGLWSFSTIYPLRQGQLSGTGSAEAHGPGERTLTRKDYFWKTVSLLPADQYNAGLDGYRSRITGSALLLMTLFFAGIWALVRLRFDEKRARFGLEQAVAERTRELRLTNDMLSLEQIRHRSLIETLPELIWLKDPESVYMLCNRHFERFFGAKEKDIVGRTDHDFVDRELADFFRANDRAAIEADRALVNEEWITFAEDGQRALLETTKLPVKTAGGQLIGVLGIGRDVTAQRAAQDCERQLKNIYRALSETNEAIIHQLDATALFERACRIAVEHGEMMLAWVGIPDAESGRIITATYCGKEPAFLKEIHPSIDPDKPEGRGPIGIAYRENRAVIVNDYETDELVSPWREIPRRHGIRSSATLPIVRNGRPYALFVVHSDRAGTFDEKIVALLQRMAGNIGFALDNLDREKSRREAERALAESEAHLKQFYDAGLVGVMYAHVDGRIMDANAKFLDMTGYSRGELDDGRLNWKRMVAPESQPAVANALAELRERGIHLKPYEKMYLRKDGRPVAVEVAAAMLDRENCVAFILDISERKKAEEGMRLAEMVYMDSSEGMMVTDESNRIISVNPAFERITGHKKEEAVGRRPSMLKSGRQSAEFYQAMWRSILDTGRWKGEVWNRTKNGEEYAASLTINTVYAPDGSVHRRVGFLSDITIRKEAEEKVWHQANFDALTGLPNRNLFREHLRQAIRHARRAKLPLALMFIDLDGFKHVNDTLGHDMGDRLLKEAADRLRACVRDIDTVARLGGDEFTVILSEIQEPDRIDRIARHILQRLSSPIRLGDEVVHVSASIGITLFPQDAEELEDLLKNADQAMYAAKQEGRNRYHFFTSGMQRAAMIRMRLINDLRGALAEGQIEIVYQPIVELSSGAIRKAEALMRWQHPRKGLVNPNDFITAAEETGLIGSLGNWMMREAVLQAAEWREKFHPDFQISVNVSPVQFRNANISLDTWTGQLRDMGLPGNAIVIEITEGLLLEASEKIKGMLLDLRDAGIEVALDDFGTGYSALSYLKKFDIDYLKIDQAFIRNLAPGSTDLALCEAIIQMAHRLGIKVIAEGVETEEQRGLLEKAECDYVQGYLYSPPLPSDRLDRFLHAGPPLCKENPHGGPAD